MENQIKFCCGNKEEGSIEILNKSKAEQKILELFKARQIEKIEIIYKEEPVHKKCTSSQS